jgi:alkylhydroperoxidase family enzyme
VTARIPQISRQDAPPESRRIWDEQVERHGRMTNMKRTLAHSPEALGALMEWYPLRDKVEPFLGKRLTTLFAHAVSVQTDCLICSTFFRRILKEAGENPDELKLDEKEQLVCDFGRQLAKDPNAVPDELFAKLAALFKPAEIVDLVAFAGLMIATNVFNNALKVDLDDYLEPYRGIVRQHK